MSQVVLSLPHLTPVERACAELYNLLDNAGAPLALFDIVLRYIEDNLGKAFANCLGEKHSLTLLPIALLFPLMRTFQLLSRLEMSLLLLLVLQMMS
jgi:hypothetical protein